MTDQSFFPSKSDTSKKLRKNFNIRAAKALQRSGELSTESRIFGNVKVPQDRHVHHHPRWLQKDIDEFVSRDDLGREITDREILNEYDYSFVTNEKAPSRFLEGGRMEVTLDELPIRWRKSNRNRLISNYEVVPQSRRVIAMRENDFEPAMGPAPVVDRNALEDDEDEDWEYLGELQDRKPISYASMASQKSKKVRNGRNV